jgi:ATP/ADP translocase/HEAT repeat protein
MKILSQMLTKLLNVHPDEKRAFGWTSGLVFLIMFSQILFGNFADTAFIKRFGVEYLPGMFLIDALIVFFAMDLIRGLVGRYSASMLLSRILVIFAGLEVLCRFLIPFNFSLLYPVMYILRLQFDGVMLVIFWNICNDIFDTRQSKRLFSLITAGGILGRILGSFSTSFLTAVTPLDNLLFISAALLLLAAMAGRRIGQLFPPPMTAPGARAVEKKGWSSPIAGVKEIGFLAKGSLLFVLLAAIRILPNLVGPLYDFQFSVILDESFASEGGLIQFYGTFRGVMSIITFVVLLFVGAVYTRVGIPNALLFRPGNYFLVFSLLLFRFDILVGIYGRLSISVLTSTMHNPANNIIINLFPDEFRAKVRPILQIVSRLGSLAGSLILLGLQAFIHASYFSIFGLFFVAVWILATLRLRKNYSSFLLETILEKQVDLRELEDVDLSVLVQDAKTLNRLLEGLRDEKGGVATLCARIMSEARYNELGEAILSVLPEKNLSIQVDLLDLLRPEDARLVVPGLVEMADNPPSGLRPHLVRTVGRLAPSENIDFLKRVCEIDEKAVQAEAIVGLYHTGMGTMGYPMLSAWLESADSDELLLGVSTVARAGEVKLESRLYAILEKETDPKILTGILEALGTLDAAQRDDRIVEWLENPSPEVRQAAVSALSLEDEKTIGRAVEKLGDESTDVREAAFKRISKIEKRAVPSLLKSLNSPKRDLKDGILRLLEKLEVKDVAFSEFITREIRSAYENLHAIQELKAFEDTPALELLTRHLEDRNNDALFTVFRILEVQGGGNEMRTIYRGLKATVRDKANAIEALESYLNPALSRVLIPLVDDIAVEEKLKVGRKHLDIIRERRADPSALLADFLDSEDSMTQKCALYVIGTGRMEGFSEKLQALGDHPDLAVRETAKQTLERLETTDQDGRGEAMLSTMDKIIHLKKIYIFSDLQVRELAAIGSITVERDYPKDEIVVKEGEAGDTMFLIISGEVSVIRNHGTEQETFIAKITEDDYFGEMALFEDKPRSATVKTDTEAKLLVLGKLEFEEIMREFPQISINICRVFSQRIREVQKKLLS